LPPLSKSVNYTQYVKQTSDRQPTMKRQAALGEFEQLVLLAVLQLKDEATGTAISTELEEKAARRVSRGALYSALDRLESKGYLTWEVEGSTPERGGHPSRLFSLTEPGLEALREQQRALRNLTEGLDEILDPGA
jgi:PadR family transcriptional regulator PadR